MSLVEVEWTGAKNDIAKIYLNNKPVNVLSLPLFNSLLSTLRELKSNQQCKGCILISKFGTTKNMFAAGFDLSLFGQNDRDLSRRYLSKFVELSLCIHKLGKPIVCVINGKNYAGGAVLACLCDYRILKGSGFVAYTGAQFGLAISQFIFDAIERVGGSAVASFVFQTAIPIYARRCKEYNLVNEVIDCAKNDDKTLVDRAIYILEKEYFNGDIEAAANARYLGRRKYIQFLENEKEIKKDIEFEVNGFHSDKVQKWINERGFNRKRKSKL
eukprot:246274_1